MYQGKNARVYVRKNSDEVALANLVNEIIQNKTVLDIGYATLQREPCVVEYVAFVTVEE